MRSKTKISFLSGLCVIALCAVSYTPFTRLVGAQSPTASMAAGSARAKLTYPPTKRVDQVDDYFGTKVPDPYRWLEENESQEVAAWVDAQNKTTFGWLDQIPYRAQLKDRLMKLLNYPKYTAPSRRGEWFFFSKNDGLQNQSVHYMQKGLDGPPELLLDPNKFSADGTSRLAAFSLSKSGHHLAYGISQGGSDWSEIYVMRVASREKLLDHLQWIKASGVSWLGDDGFFYSRYPAPEKGKELVTKNEFQAVYFHKIGTQQSDDQLIYDDKEHPQRFQGVGVTEDQRFAILNVSDRGKGKKGNAIFYRDLSKGEKGFTPIVGEIGDDTYGILDSIDGKFLIMTNHNAPNQRVVLVDPANPGEANWKEILPEKADPIEGVSSAGGKLFVTYSKDVANRSYVYSLDGKLENEIALPGLGNSGGFGGRHDDKFVFYSFSSFNIPPTIYKYEIATMKSTVFRTVEIPGFKAGDYITEEKFYQSKDGTRVPIFITYKKGLKMDGNNPTILYGYGGFNITTSPNFSSLRLALLEQGVVYASANIRGGSEYGEKWHEAGTKLKKQNVFDDFIAAAEFLIANKYTSSAKLAIDGASNGGLLVGAVTNQRPDLFRAVHQHAGVMDMLRYHLFTIGWNWAADYGRSDASEAEFKALYAYSPIHNAKPGTRYPAILITTADHDDRVVPAHSFKYAAVMQAAQAGDSPILIRIDTKSGHGASSTTKQLEQTADADAFFFETLGVTPKW